jgi:hypothetical protein
VKLGAAGGSPDRVAAASQYETLRLAALGEPVPPEYRSGLVLFLRRGMWSWARALATAVTPRPPIRSSSLGSTAADPQRAVIQVLAAMALELNHERAT